MNLKVIKSKKKLSRHLLSALHSSKDWIACRCASSIRARTGSKLCQVAHYIGQAVATIVQIFKQSGHAWRGRSVTKAARATRVRAIAKPAFIQRRRTCIAHIETRNCIVTCCKTNFIVWRTCWTWVWTWDRIGDVCAVFVHVLYTLKHAIKPVIYMGSENCDSFEENTKVLIGRAHGAWCRLKCCPWLISYFW